MLVWPGNADWLVPVLYVYIIHQCKNGIWWQSCSHYPWGISHTAWSLFT